MKELYIIMINNLTLKLIIKKKKLVKYNLVKNNIPNG